MQFCCTKQTVANSSSTVDNIYIAFIAVPNKSGVRVVSLNVKIIVIEASGSSCRVVSVAPRSVVESVCVPTRFLFKRAFPVRVRIEAVRC